MPSVPVFQNRERWSKQVVDHVLIAKILPDPLPRRESLIYHTYLSRARWGSGRGKVFIASLSRQEHQRLLQRQRH
jgi:hypothetical protein